MQTRIFADWRGGRNGVDSPLDPTFPDNQVVEAVNIAYDRCTLGGKRGGMTTLSQTGGSSTTGGLQLFVHQPGADPTTAELWLVDSAGTPLLKRLAGGTSWANVTVGDAIAVSGPLITSISFNSKLYICYPSAQDRLHVWDGSSLRRVGLPDPTTGPTVANTGGGAYAATLRYYRVRWVHIGTSGPNTIIVRKGEPTDGVAFTPSGAGTAARVTQPTPPGEGETHWEVEVSLDNVNYYKLAATGPGAGGGTILGVTGAQAVGTTTYDDSTATTAYTSQTLSEVLGTYYAPVSVRFGITDGNRLIFGSAFTNTAAYGARVWYTPVLGSGNADDERIPDLLTRKSYADLNVRDGGDLTGLGGPIDGIIWAFKYRQIWRGTPTGNVDAPYVWRRISDTIGALNHKCIFIGEDAQGHACLYFLSHQGPYRLGPDGLQYLGRDIEDLWRGFNTFSSGVNFNAAYGVAHGVFDALEGRAEWCLATGSNDFPNLQIALDVKQATRVDQYGVRGGWTRHTLPVTVLSSVMFAETPGASMSLKQKPYHGRSNATIVKTRDNSAVNDAGTSFQAYLLTKNLVPMSLQGAHLGLRESLLVAYPVTAGLLSTWVLSDFGVTTGNPLFIELTAEASATRIIRLIDDLMESDLTVAQLYVGDNAASDNGQWRLEALVLRYSDQGVLPHGAIGSYVVANP